VRRLLAVLLALGLLTGCGTATFSNSFAVSVERAQEVSVFDSTMGQSAEWATATMGTAAPGKPYTTRINVTDTKLILDSSPPTSVQVGLYLPDVTETGFFAISLPDVTEGSIRVDAPFVAWYSEDPVDQLPPLPMDLDIAAGDEGWVINIAATGQA